MDDSTPEWFRGVSFGGSMRIVDPAETLAFPFWEALSAALHKESAIMAGRNRPEQLADLHARGLAVVALDEHEQPLGFIAAWPLAPGFLEIGSAWVHPDHRRHGIATQLYQTLDTRPALASSVCFGITTSEASVRAGRHARLAIHTNWQDPVPWELTCGTCEKRTTENARRSCTLRDGACILRIRS